MEIDLVLKNYRCFPDTHPARLSLRPGFIGLVGPNNSGKSSLLRFLFEFRGLFRFLTSPTGNFFEGLRGNPQGVFNYPATVQDPTEMFSNQNNRDLVIEIVARKDGKGSPSSIPGPRGVAITVPRGTNQFTARMEAETPASNLGNLAFDGTILRSDNVPWVDLAFWWEACRLLGDTLYVGPFRNAINLGGAGSYFDIQTGQAFIAAWKQFKQGTSKAQAEAAWRLKNDIRAIFGFKDLGISPSQDESTLTLMIDGRSYRLDEQGSGLAHFVIVLANVVTRRPAYVLIDEPEMGLHPSLQLDFLTTLASYASEGVLFASHSIGLARSAATLLYSLRRASEGHSEIAPFEATPDLAEFMGELGFTAYKELGFEQVLLVEGPSELNTIQQLLRQYGKEHSIVLLSLGGTQMINAASQAALDNVLRITDKVAALIDSEKSGPNDALAPERQRFVENCAKVGIKCHVLALRAFENYLPERAVQVVKGASFRALTPYERLKDANPSWSKSENWRIAREMTRDELDATDLGRFLRAL